MQIFNRFTKLIKSYYNDFNEVMCYSFVSAGLALLIAQSTVQIGKGLARNRSPIRGAEGNSKHPAARCNFQPIKDLELDSSGPESSEPETSL